MIVHGCCDNSASSSPWERAGRRGHHWPRNGSRASIAKEDQSVDCEGLMLQLNFNGNDIPLTRARKVCAWRIMWNKPIRMSRWHSSAESYKTPKTGNTRPTFYIMRVFYLFTPWPGTKKRAKIWQVNGFFYFKYLCLTRAAIFTVAFASVMQLGSGMHRTVRSRSGKGGLQMGIIRCSAPCSDWLMPTETSRLNTRAF